jgi:mannose-6-phosphate isomerase-like protein (cupin superfamily)
MSRILKNSQSKKHDVPDFQVMGTISPDISEKINNMVTSKKANDVIDIIDHVNSILECKIYNVNVDTWTEPFESDWTNSTVYDKPVGKLFVVTKGKTQLHVDKGIYELVQNKIYFVNEWCTHRVVSQYSTPLTMLLASFDWDSSIHRS